MAFEPIHSRPEAPEMSGLELSWLASPPAACEVGAFEQVVGELDARADAAHLRRRQRVVDCVGERLGWWRRTRADSQGQRGYADPDSHHHAAQQQQAGEGEAAQDVHVSTSSVRDSRPTFSVAPNLGLPKGI